jgi:hypothetical protein
MASTVHPDPARRSKLSTNRNPDPIEVVLGAEALTHRYCALVSMLQRGELDGWGLPTGSDSPGIILHSIWSHEDFHFDARSGDILQHNPESKDRYDRLIRRWIGVVLQKPVNAVPQKVISSGNHALGLQAGLSVAADISESNAAAFTVAEVIALGSLSEALNRLVFNHPEVRVLRARALAVARDQAEPFDEHAHLMAPVYGHHEPLLPLRHFRTDGDEVVAHLPDENQQNENGCAGLLDDPIPAEIGAYYDAVNRRASTLIEMLRSRRAVARGHVGDGHLVLIAHSIWTHEDYYVHPPTGDVYEAGPGS